MKRTRFLGLNLNIGREAGLSAAAVLAVICDQIEQRQKQKDESCYIDGTWWVPLSLNDIEYCLWGLIKRTAIYDNTKKLKELGVLNIENLNKVKYDRTKWYSINEEELEKYK